ncbi:MAG: hypothetical protein IJW40_03485 [Clostridia bacterium]|nr:hypothetical protein [Clostridia bacterium]
MMKIRWITLLTTLFKGHKDSKCPQYIMSRGKYFIISQLESETGVVLYFDADSMGNTIFRYDQTTQTTTVVGVNLSSTGSTWRFDPYTQTIYYTAYRSESPSGMSMCSLDTKSGEIRILCDIDELMFASYIEGDTLYADTIIASVYAINLTEEFSDAVKVINMDRTHFRGRAIDSDYFYFDLRERLYYSVPQEILDRYHATFDPDRYMAVQDKIYRIPLDSPDAEPELPLENASLGTIQNGKLLYVIHDMEPIFSYVVDRAGKLHHWADPNAPTDGDLRYIFSLDSGSAGIIDLATMTEEVTFALDRYRFEPTVGLYFDGTGVICGGLLDYDEETFIATKILSPKRYFFSLPLTGGIITDEDIIPLTLN